MTLVELLAGVLLVLKDDREMTQRSHQCGDGIVRDTDAKAELANLDALITEIEKRKAPPARTATRGMILATGMEIWSQITDDDQRKFCSDQITDLLAALEDEEKQEDEEPKFKTW